MSEERIEREMIEVDRMISIRNDVIVERVSREVREGYQRYAMERESLCQMIFKKDELDYDDSKADIMYLHFAEDSLNPTIAEILYYLNQIYLDNEMSEYCFASQSWFETLWRYYMIEVAILEEDERRFLERVDGLVTDDEDDDREVCEDEGDILDREAREVREAYRMYVMERIREEENLELIMELPTYDFEDSDEDSDEKPPRLEEWVIDMFKRVSDRMRTWDRHLRDWNRDVATYGERESWRKVEKKVEKEMRKIDRTGLSYNTSKMLDKKTFLLMYLGKKDFQSTVEHDELRTPNYGGLVSKEILHEELTTDCVICFDSNERCLYKLECNHIFHWGCVRDWLDNLARNQMRLTCPMCRGDVSCRILEVPSIRVVRSHGLVE